MTLYIRRIFLGVFRLSRDDAADVDLVEQLQGLGRWKAVTSRQETMEVEDGAECTAGSIERVATIFGATVWRNLAVTLLGRDRLGLPPDVLFIDAKIPVLATSIDHEGRGPPLTPWPRRF
ncbi:MAG: hypothetical protein OXF56_11405 [Rhodobacteraceae bacterium]|nr:hypothetical protein [Paracoccaceae bacterium]